MPRLNRTGDIGAGIGGLQVSINRQVIAEPAGESEWATDGRLAYVHHGTGIKLGFETIYPGGANFLRAGGGLVGWSVRERIDGVERWVTRFSDGQPAMLDVVIAGIGPDATIHVTEDGLTHGVHAASFQALPGGRWTAVRYGDYRPVDSSGVPPAALPSGPIYGLRRTYDDRFIVYSNDDGRIRVQHRDDTKRGYFLREQDGTIIVSNAFRPDIVVLSDETIKVTYSISEGEIPAHIRDFIVHQSQLVEDVGGTPVVPIEPIVPIGHKMWLGFYVGDPAGPGGWHTDMPKTWPPGNAYLDVITSTIRKKDGSQIAKYLHASSSMTVAEIEQRVNELAADGSTVAAYYDAAPGTPWPGPPNFPKGTVQLVQAYKLKTESFTAFEQRVEAEIIRIEQERPHHVPGLNPQSYLRNDLESNLAALVPIYARIAQRHPQLTFMIPFSGTGRKDGLWQNTSVVPYWEELFAGVTGEPTGGGGDVSAPNELAVVKQVDQEFPHLLQINTIVSCTEFTQRVLERLNAEWGHVGKTAGEGQGVPVGFQPRQVRGVDGNMYLITGVSYDVIFHEPTWRQVDIIAKGTANEPGPWEHGPGSPMWGEIEPSLYRAYNPWVEKFPLVLIPPDPPPGGDKPVLLVINYPSFYQRGTLEGLVVVTNVSRPPDGAFVDLLEVWLSDGAPRMRFKLEPPGGTWDLGEKDLPYLPTVGWKPDLNGSFDLFARCRTADGRWSDDVKGDHQVTITSP